MSDIDKLKVAIGEMILNKEIMFELEYDRVESSIALIIEVSIPSDDGYTEETRFEADRINIR